MEQHLIYYIDQYLNDQFVSRSEPFYERTLCEQVLSELCFNTYENIHYRMNVSMPIKEYDSLVLSSNKIRIKFLEKEPDFTTECKDECLETTDDLSEKEPDRENSSVTTDPLLDSFVEDSHIHDTGYELIENTKKNYVAYKYSKGYVMKNSKKNRDFMDTHLLRELFVPANEDNSYQYISKSDLIYYDIDFLNLVKIKKKTEKVKDALIK